MGQSGEGAPPHGEAPSATVPRRSRRALAVGVVAGVVVAIAIGALFATRPAAPAEDTKLVEALIEETGRELAARTWERPVLRGAPLEGDGIRAHEAAVLAFADRRREAGLGRRDSDPMTDPAAELLVLGDALDDIRLALQYESFPSVWAGDYLPPLHTHYKIDALFLEAARSAVSAGECLELVADRIRFDQDHVLGDGTPMYLALEEVSQVALACAARASAAELAAASWEMRELATSWPPVLRELQRDALDDLARRFRSRSSHDLAHLSGTALARRRAAEAQSVARVRALNDAEALGHAELQALAHEVYAEPGGEVERTGDLSNHARAVVQTKQLALALAWLEGAWHPPDLPDDAIAIDPYTGQPMRAKVAGDGIRIVSLGRDGEPNTSSYRDDIMLAVRPRGADQGGTSRPDP